ncbi:MAG: Lon-like protease helical domain-containing protein [Candidatus Latescibacterota bacterium]
MSVTPSAIPVRELAPEQLYRRCGPEELGFQTTAELEPLEQPVGQPRAVEALRFGLGMSCEGYNIYALGPPGTGKHAVVRQHLERGAARAPAPSDWCYVHNFQTPHRPPGMGHPRRPAPVPCVATTSTCWSTPATGTGRPWSTRTTRPITTSSAGRSTGRSWGPC